MSTNKIYDQWNKHLKLQKIINASGKMTALGVSVISGDVADAFVGGAKHFVNIEELYSKAGSAAAEIVGAESGVVVNSASAGIAQSIAGLIHKGNKKYIYSPIKAALEDNIPNEIILPKGHNINYGGPIDAMIEIAGGKIMEAGWSNRCNEEDIEIQITDRTVALMYVKSHHAVQKSILSFEQMSKLAKKHKIPMIIDIAAEEEIKKYLDLDIDLIIWSGSKAVAGPASGFVFGKKECVSWVYEEHIGLGRSMKVDKGLVFAALESLKTYIAKRPIVDENILNYINENITKKDYLTVSIVNDDSGRDLKRVKMQLITKKAPITAFEMIKQLESGDVGIHTRKHKANEDIIFIDVRSVNMDESKCLVGKINDILKIK